MSATHMTVSRSAQLRKSRNALVKNPAKFYGKSGNWFSRLLERIFVIFT